jgi:transposase, IS30 family
MVYDNCKEDIMPHLNQQERYQIHAYKESGLSHRQIGVVLGRHHSVISREVTRNGCISGYHADQAQFHATSRKSKASRRVRVMTLQMVRDIEQCLRLRQWSPVQISGYLRDRGTPVSHESIYCHIWRDKRADGFLYRHLRHRGKKYHKRGNALAGRGLIPNRRDIEERPAIVDTKSRLGDWEADTIIGAGHRGALLSLVERHSKYTLIAPLPSKHAAHVTQAIITLLTQSNLPVHTITFDNGKEFAQHQTIENTLQTKCFFAKPYHSWQRGLNEHTNGLIRQYFPKQTRLDTVTMKQVQHVQHLLNQRPRAVLKFKTPYQVAYAEHQNTGAFRC